MSPQTHGRVVAVLFIFGAIARSIVGGLGYVKLVDLCGLISVLALMSLGVRDLLSPTKQSRFSAILLQRVYTLLIVVGTLVFCWWLLLSLFSEILSEKRLTMRRVL